jgi:phosphorylase kinase alpha/beta subunit
MTDEYFTHAIAEHLGEVRALQTATGLFTASAHNVSTGYNKAWLRDAYFMSLGFTYAGEHSVVKKLASALLEILMKHSHKIEWAITHKPFESWQYIHARYNPDTFDEYWEEWGNKQNDAVSEVLYLLADLELRGESVLDTDEKRAMVQKLVDYLARIEYWHDPDSGIWEEYQEVHASSVGACVSALRLAARLSFVTVPEGLIARGEETLRKLLPRESESKFCDLALLTLIFPFAVTTEEETLQILANVEYFLTRDRGIIRYKNDRYYNRNNDGYSEEAEWCMGLSWLAIIYADRGDLTRAQHFLDRAKLTIDPAGKIPELYFSHTDQPNENVPLGWAESMYVVALIKVRALLSAK